MLVGGGKGAAWRAFTACAVLVGCNGSGSSDPPAEGRVCPEAYVCSVGCVAGPASDEAGCLSECVDRATAEAGSLIRQVLDCRARRCAGTDMPLEVCLFDRCAAEMSACLADARQVSNPCPGAIPNALGVGKACEERAVCDGQVAWNCPYEMPAPQDRDRDNLPRWCSMLCDSDEHCGPDAFCWQRESLEGVVVGSCALVECRLDFLPEGR